ncbi:molybdenum cofactor biosynthesis protein A [Planctomycetes bacterium Poly30]|uniref:Molybdenum cofactor biosynthesis protein A n=1 Tax=Saltatorellus ferox TaxID=2528018 RepID=A0A518EYL7_9BACT|nr:molybdenum cofactor biosynthesis protein A [Planctomycetes bacterium Poly30]
MPRLRPLIRHARKHPRYFAHLALKKVQFAARYRWIREHGASDRARPDPLVVKLMLNWRCNLRCPMCMLWGDVGWVKSVQENHDADLPWEVVSKIFGRGLPRNASFILSGGEPLMYPHFGRLMGELKRHRHFAVTCTNGLLLDRFAEEMDGNPYPTFLISLDGHEQANDALRGKGVYRRVMANIETLQRLKRPPFIAIQFTVMPENVASITSFCEEMVALGVDWILLNPGWFISPKQADAYEHFMRDRFGVEAKTDRGYVREYDYDKEEFEAQLRAVRERRWPIQIGSHLHEPEWVTDFIDEPDKILGDRLCYKQWLRLDVLPDGKVPPCVQFPDYSVGDLRTESVDEVWQGEANRRFQKVITEESLPVCAKCDNLYLYGPRRAQG